MNNAQPWKDVAPSGRLLRPAEVTKVTGLSRSQVYQMIADGRFPPFIKLSERASALPQSWLDAFILSRVEHALGGISTSTSASDPPLSERT